MNRMLKIFLFFLAAVVLAVAAWFLLLKPSSLFSSIPFVTTASLGREGDPINIVLAGDKDSIIKTFLAAHWVIPDTIDASSTVRIALASLTDSPYPAAPVSNLYLFGRAQDLVFEFPTGTVRQRHHVRLWQTTKSITGKPLWVGAASFDSGIELSGKTALPTHHVSPNTDAEKSFIVASLERTGLLQEPSFERIARPTLWSFNAAGDWYFENGLVAVLILK